MNNRQKRSKKPKRYNQPDQPVPKVQEPEQRYLLPVLIGLIIIGTILRFYHLDFNSLWLDEISTYHYASRSLDVMWQTMATGTDYSPPLFFFLEHLVISALGVSEWSLRLLPAIFGVVTIPVMYLVGKEFWDENVGLISAGFFTFSPFLIFYSQEARAYALALLILVIEFYLFLRAIKSEEVKDWAFFGLVAGLGIWTHFYTIVFTALLVGYLVIRNAKSFIKDIKTVKAPAIGVSVLILTALPILVAVVPLYVQHTSSAPTYGVQGLNVVYTTFIQMSGYADYAAIILLLLFVIGAFVVWKQDHTYTGLSLVWIMVGTFLISIYLSYKMPFIPRYVIFLTIPLSLGIAMVYSGARNLLPEKVPTNLITAVLVILIVAISVPFYIQYYQSYSKENWKGIASDLKMITAPGDTVITVPSYLENTLGYYYSPADDGTIYGGLSTADGLAVTHPAAGNSIYYVVTPDINAADPSGQALAWLSQNTNIVRNYGSVYILKGK